MRNCKELKVIASQLDMLDELKQRLENIVDYINMLTKKGKSWIEEKEKLTYIEINQYLANETAECFKRYEKLAGHQDLQNSTNTLSHSNEQLPSVEGNSANVLTYCEQLDKIISSQRKEIKKLKRKQEDQEKRINSIAIQKEESDSKYDVLLDDIMGEFHSASDFMTSLHTAMTSLQTDMTSLQTDMASLQTQLETLNTTVKENESKVEEMSTVCERMFSVERKQTDQEGKVQELYRTHDEVEKRLNLKHVECINELHGLTERLDELCSQQKRTLDKLSENETATTILKSSVDEMHSQHKRLLDNESKLCGVIISITNLEQALQHHVELINVIKYNLKRQEEINMKQFEGIRNKASDLVGDLQKESKGLSTNILELKKCFKETTASVLTQKKDITRVSNELSTFKMSTDTFITKQLEISESMDSTIKSFKVQIQDVTGKLDNLSIKLSEAGTREEAVAFCAQIPQNICLKDLKKDQILKCFNRVINNSRTLSLGYNPDTGIFTAPCNGIYLVGLMAENLGHENFHLIKSSGDELTKFQLTLSLKGAVGCAVVPVTICKNDHIYVKPDNDYPSIQLGIYSYFMCILIKEF